MKYLAKQISLLGAFALLLSVVPAQAMGQAPADVQQEVTAKRRWFSGFTKEALDKRLKNAREELDHAWKPFIKCLTKGEDCTQKARTIRHILGTIIALVGVLGVTWVGTKLAGRGALTAQDKRLIQAAQAYDTAKEGTISAMELLLEKLSQYSSNALIQARDILQNKNAELANKITQYIQSLGKEAEYGTLERPGLFESHDAPDYPYTMPKAGEVGF